jgi:dimethylamine monooxygenase subunit B
MMATQRLAVRVRAIEPLSPTLKHIVLQPADGGLLPTSMPGAHLALILPGEKRDYRNSYSITTKPDERSRYEIIVRRTANSRGGSDFIHAELKPGGILASAIPNSQFPLQNLARKHLLIGGGIGITPFLSFFPVLRARSEWLEMHQFCAPGEVSVFERLLEPFAGPDIQVHASRQAISLTDLLARQPLGTHVYCCGPSGLMDAVRDTALALGWPPMRVHLESFGAFGGESFRVKLSQSSREIPIGEHESMLEALENAGVEMPSLCRGGACGECLSTVLDGIPDHRDHFLTADEKAEGRLVMPCVSRAKTPTLTLAR